MKFFVQTTAATPVKNRLIRGVSIALAAIFTAMVVAQLFTFEKFPEVIAVMGLPGDILVADLRAALIVVFEVFALPFLLSMRLSPLMRVISMVSGWIVAAAWLAVSIRLVATGSDTDNGGLLGATVALAPGVWMIVGCTLLATLVGYVSWGMWPRVRRK